METVQHLLAAGAPLHPQRPLPSNLTPLAVEACCCGNVEVLDLILDADPASMAVVDPVQGAGLLHWAAASGNVSGAHLLLSRGVDVMRADFQGLLAHHYAATGGLRCMLRVLLTHGGIGVDTPTSEGATALMLASAACQERCVEFLLAQGANVALTDAMGRTALWTAAAGGHAQVARLLLRAGASAVVADAVQRRSVLHWVSYYGQAALVEELLQDTQTTLDVEDAAG